MTPSITHILFFFHIVTYPLLEKLSYLYIKVKVTLKNVIFLNK